MEYIKYDTQPIAEVQGSAPDEVQARYRDMMRYDIPGFIIRQCDLQTLDGLVVPQGLAVRGYVQGNILMGHEDKRRQDDVVHEPTYHADDLPVPGSASTVHHHFTTVGSHILTLATFAPKFAKEFFGLNAEERFDRLGDLAETLDDTLGRGNLDPEMVAPDVYRSLVNTGDIAVLRIKGEVPVVHLFDTQPDSGYPRGVILRGYVAQPLPPESKTTSEPQPEARSVITVQTKPSAANVATSSIGEVDAEKMAVGEKLNEGLESLQRAAAALEVAQATMSYFGEGSTQPDYAEIYYQYTNALETITRIQQQIQATQGFAKPTG